MNIELSVIIGIFVAVLCLLIGLFWARRLLVRQPFTSGFFSNQNENCHYSISGSGPHLVLLHGIGASSFIWRHMLQPLNARYTVIQIDLPGFGRSHKDPAADYGLDAQTERVHTILQHLYINECYIIGSSMGGTLALNLARLYPHKIKKVVAIAPATNRRLVPKIPLPMNVQIRMAREAIVTPFIMRKVLRRVVYNFEKLTDEVIAEYMSPYLSDPNTVLTFFRALDLLRDVRLPHIFKSVTNPTLILWGDKDKMVPKRIVTELMRNLPNAKLMTRQNAGHHLMEDDPDWTTAQCVLFFSQEN